MEKIKVKTGQRYFAIAEFPTATYVIPGWTPVPPGTTREMIELDVSDLSIPGLDASKVTQGPPQEWSVESSKKGAFYVVSLRAGQWDCTCPAKAFHRGDCKHIKGIKSQKNIT